MKQHLFFIVVLLTFSLPVYSQTPYQIVDTTKSWNTMNMGFIIWGVAVCGGTKTDKFLNTNTFNGQIYRKVYEISDSAQTSWDEVGLIREDTLSNRIYFTDGYEPEGLLYDFSIAVGDTVNIENLYRGFSSTLVCDNIDTVMVSGAPKRRFRFHAIYQNRDVVDETWIEGIGSLYGVLNSGLGGSGITGGTSVLLCCKQNGSIIYFNATYNSCYIETFYPQIIQDSYDTAYVNTPYTFQVELDTGNALNFNLIGDVIPDDLYFDPATGLLFGTPAQSGLFNCVITVKNNQLNLLTDIIYTDLVVVLPDGFKEKTDVNQIKIFPNPFSDKVTIELPKNINKGTIEVVNTAGKTCVRKILNKRISHINFSHLPQGVYYFKYSDYNGKPIKTIITLKQ